MPALCKQFTRRSADTIGVFPAVAHTTHRVACEQAYLLGRVSRANELSGSQILGRSLSPLTVP